MAKDAVVLRTEAANREAVRRGTVKNEIGATISFEKISKKLLGFCRDFIGTITDDMSCVTPVNCFESLWTNSGIVVACKLASSFKRQHVLILRRDETGRQRKSPPCSMPA